MPLGYLASVVVLGLCTWCALWPIRGAGPAATTTYLLGMVYNELPVLAVGLALLTVLTTDRLLGPVGLLSSGLLAVVLTGQAMILGRAIRARHVPERAMAEALGPTWRSEIDPRLAVGLPDTVPWPKVLLAPFVRRRRHVERVKNLAYGDEGRRHRLDVYRHRTHPTGCPVLVHFHGGRFVSGAKSRESLPLLHRLADHGWVCVSANYRLGPKASYPDYVVDAKRVLAWVRRHGAEHGGDPATVFVAGNSAGGYLAAFCALTANEPGLQPGFVDVDTAVSGAICLYGYYGRTESRRPESSPSAHLKVDVPPVLLVHGQANSVIPVERARAFADELSLASDQAVVPMELPGAQHSFDYFDTPRSRLVANEIEAFAAWVRSRSQREAS